MRKLAAREADAGAHRPPLIACLGDSVTHGCFEVFMNRHGEIDTRYDPQNGYCARLERRLQAYYPKAAVTVLNAGVSGQRAADGLRRLERDVVDRKPDLVIVNFALNDCMDGRKALDAYRRAMNEIFVRLKAAMIEGILLTPNRMCAYVSPGITDAALVNAAEQAALRQTQGVLDAFVEAGREAARANHVPIADAYAVWNRLEATGADTTQLLANAINHPIAQAHDLFVDAIMRVLLEA